MANGTDEFDHHREVFHRFENKDDEKISIQQLGDVMRALEQEIPEDDIKRCVASFDQEIRLSCEKFVEICRSFTKTNKKHPGSDFVESPLSEDSARFDNEGNEIINDAELRHLEEPTVTEPVSNDPCTPPAAPKRMQSPDVEAGPLAKKSERDVMNIDTENMEEAHVEVMIEEKKPLPVFKIVSVDDGDDDDVVFVGAVEKVTQPVIKKIVEVLDEHGDEELAVIAKVEYDSGVLPSTIGAKSREKKHKCTKCSAAFLTEASLSRHIASICNTETSVENFGIPKECVGHICRFCCLVFEDRQTYERHASRHLERHNCRKCSGIDFSLVRYTDHLKAHKNRTVYFACGSCLIKFFTYSHLMEHLTNEHNVPLFSFCKVCEVGSTSMDFVFEHILTTHTTNYTLPQTLGFCPATLLNFEPRDVETFKSLVASDNEILIKPSDCSHRSLLMAEDPLISCKNCHSTILLSTVAYNGTDNSLQLTLPEPRTMLHRLFPLLSKLSRKNADIMIQRGRMRSAPATNEENQNNSMEKLIDC